uniref:Uncharacterized protein n=1 Tax=Nelumbo nucifera TaxID=4432 RepID=A0A822ZGI8_NELNU|nr:TPA_asm: hypothetical protein HUJ06_001943 [Nelumbo nucifera]
MSSFRTVVKNDSEPICSSSWPMMINCDNNLADEE